MWAVTKLFAPLRGVYLVLSADVYFPSVTSISLKQLNFAKAHNDNINLSLTKLLPFVATLLGNNQPIILWKIFTA